ncbi:MAG: single-stranded DNA-binding protein [Lentilactobacillus diolivorans]|jgi:single-strand DNA-binding protein|uniref:Single-stranded DNA-binding protein n=2 Tax=Lentilactobacillus diolivorans TaxID=179838 RepID=A0A0R1SM16_9LACO|nr:single-stranded DNA-binding protein [Lentilactobacillus diolivorans]RRG03822.1 MAG: single-stranded DNA-binding protein [Lactobacillus sp.]KRL69518.1 single-strand DNA-binding protein [Lentilactobacillus diolivorans DSM 14421]MCH4163368.1 single-stranded DNA-binding protein [Lentilactobacillus diolivorans]MDH5104857.1 single-stranded DNA-binding protein [Lentilactobacillus diolivorans]GEP23841.1 single-stranded DNA-binding protein [Lentilactobacillus diolivorans]
MLNRAVLTGRLTRDVDLRYTQSGAAVGTFSLAVDRRFTNQQGEREADFINCVIWRKSAENFANFVHKGSLVGIDGRIQTRNYENQQGQRVYVTEVVVENFALLEPKSSRHGNSNNQQNGNAPQQNNGNGNNPFDNNSNNPSSGNSNNGGNSSNSGNSGNNNPADPFANSGDSIDISDDDLPF